MKRIFTLALATLLTLATNAQLNGNGYYRVKNNGTGNYIRVSDNTGSINYATTSADMGSLQLHKGLENSIHEAGSVVYFTDKGDDYWDISSQGTSVYKIISNLVKLTSATKNGVTLYEVSATKSGTTLYLYDGGSTGFGYNALKTSGKVADRKWKIEPIDSKGDNYFGIKPTLSAGGKHYQPFYAAFPFSFASSGMKAYYICKVDGNIAVLKEYKQDIIPAMTPLLIECSSQNTADNRLNLLTGQSENISGNCLKGVFFCNDFRPESKDASTEFKPATMRVWNVDSNGNLALNTDNSELQRGEFDPDRVMLNSNTSYLPVAEGTASELTIMTEEEYNKISGIEEIIANSKKVNYYTTGGQKLRKAQNGLNIVRTSDGQTFKIRVK